MREDSRSTKGRKGGKPAPPKQNQRNAVRIISTLCQTQYNSIQLDNHLGSSGKLTSFHQALIGTQARISGADCRFWFVELHGKLGKAKETANAVWAAWHCLPELKWLGQPADALHGLCVCEAGVSEVW